jgi:VanZ family protein
MAVIFHFSSQSDPVPQITTAVWDKLLHFVEYGALATLLARALLGEGLTVPAAVVAAVLLTSAYGVTDEFHQSRVPQRQADVQDWMVDTLGGAAGAAFGALKPGRRFSRA